MTVGRINILWPIFIIAAAVLWILQSLGVLPSVLSDLLLRAWPALLVAFGLMLLLGRRVRFGNVIALVLAAVLVGGVAYAAYNQAGDHVVTENKKPFQQVLDPQLSTVKINVTMRVDEIEVTPSTNPQPIIAGEFQGSSESHMTSDFQTDGTTGTFTFNETQTSGLVPLSSIGRGKLTLSLPIGINLTQLDVVINSQGGSIKFNAAGTALKELALSTKKGAITLGTLPITVTDLALTTNTDSLDVDASATALQNVNLTASAGNVSLKVPDKSGLVGYLKSGGDASITIPPTIAAQIALLSNAANGPTYNQNDYILNKDNVLVSRKSSDPQMQIKIEAGGRAKIQ